ncbi:MAG: HlyD family efflux transporter periplasmic adaptor subunit [Verrucomicrobia bacterium]|nr:HlyD family efflux transporter periplasmic adaptor subunit [Verrucomicrobiota bacterium]
MNPPLPPLPTAPPRRNNTHRRKRWLPWLGAALLVALIVIGFLPQPTPVETARAARGTLRATVNEEGKTRIKQRYLVSAPVGGHLRRLPFKAGAEVIAGQTVLAVIDPLSPALLDARNRALAQARRDTAAANLEKAREAHRFAASELRRFQKLHDEKAVSLQELEPVQWRETATAKDCAAAESALRQAEAELAEFPVRSGDRAASDQAAPVEVKALVCGRVLRLFEESTRVVAAGTPLLEIGDPADLEVVIEVLSRDGAAIAPGTKVELEQWGGGEPLQARVRLVEPAAFTKVSALGVEEQRVNVVADLVTPFEQRRNLGDNFRVEARIVVWEADQVLKVPAGALFRRGRDWAAFVIANGRSQLRRVQVGRSSGSEMQILGGLQDGEEVILYPGDRVREGQRVRPIQI